MNIHIVEIKNNFVKLNKDEWESGWWPMEESVAQKLVGGNIYFHKTRQEPSFYGGRILGYRIEEAQEHQGLIVFKLKYQKECRDIKTEKGGWSRSLKITGMDDAVSANENA